MMDATDQMRDFARRYTAAWCSQDPAQVAGHYAPDGSLTINDGVPAVGRDAITEVAVPCRSGRSGRGQRDEKQGTCPSPVYPRERWGHRYLIHGLT